MPFPPFFSISELIIKKIEKMIRQTSHIHIAYIYQKNFLQNHFPSSLGIKIPSKKMVHI